MMSDDLTHKDFAMNHLLSSFRSLHLLLNDKLCSTLTVIFLQLLTVIISKRQKKTSHKIRLFKKGLKSPKKYLLQDFKALPSSVISFARRVLKELFGVQLYGAVSIEHTSSISIFT